MRRSSSPLVVLRARQHRCCLTDTEALLWARIRGCRLGVWFRRQVPLGRYIVDFVAPGARLVVEVDGGYHSTRDGADRRRDAQLARLGFRTLRVAAARVRDDMPAVLELIRAALMQGE